MATFLLPIELYLGRHCNKQRCAACFSPVVVAQSTHVTLILTWPHGYHLATERALLGSLRENHTTHCHVSCLVDLQRPPPRYRHTLRQLPMLARPIPPLHGLAIAVSVLSPACSPILLRP